MSIFLNIVTINAFLYMEDLAINDGSAIAAIREGRMAGTIAQQPALIGSTAVDNAVILISGQGIAPSIPVEVTLITAANAG